MHNRTRPILIRFYVNPEELAILEQKQEECRMTSREAMIRKLIFEGNILMLDIPEIRELSANLRRCTGSLNQIAKRVNITGRLYENDLKETKSSLDDMTEMIRRIYQQLTEIKTLPKREDAVPRTRCPPAFSVGKRRNALWQQPI